MSWIMYFLSDIYILPSGIESRDPHRQQVDYLLSDNSGVPLSEDLR